MLLLQAAVPQQPGQQQLRHTQSAASNRLHHLPRPLLLLLLYIRICSYRPCRTALAGQPRLQCTRSLGYKALRDSFQG
jgi:hypothetical protein